MPWQELEHTADWSIHVWADDKRSLYEEAARGMISLLEGEAEGEPAQHTIEVTGIDAEVLMVKWLTELVILIEEGTVIDEVTVDSLDGLTLHATVIARPDGTYSDHIKAVTYHEMDIHQTERGYETTIVFDL